MLASTVLSWAHGVATTVDGQVDAGDEAGGVGRQEGDALSHLLHLAWPPEGVGLLTLGEELVVRRKRGWRCSNTLNKVFLHRSAITL